MENVGLLEDIIKYGKMPEIIAPQNGDQLAVLHIFLLYVYGTNIVIIIGNILILQLSTQSFPTIMFWVKLKVQQDGLDCPPNLKILPGLMETNWIMKNGPTMVT